MPPHVAVPEQDVLDRTISHTTESAYRGVQLERQRTDTTTVVRGMRCVVAAEGLLRALKNIFPFADPDHRTHIRLEVSNGIFTVLGTDHRVLARETLSLQRPRDEEDNEHYRTHEGVFALGPEEARYLIKLLREPSKWRDVRIALSSTDTRTTTAWAETPIMAAEQTTALRQALTVSVLIPSSCHGVGSVTVTLPGVSYAGDITDKEVQGLHRLTEHRTVPTPTILLDPALLVKFAKVTTASSAYSANPVEMAVSLAGPDKALKVTIGDQFEAIVMPLLVWAGAKRAAAA